MKKGTRRKKGRRTLSARKRTKTLAAKTLAGLKAKKVRGQTVTYGLSSISSADPSTPFTLTIRPPGWFPDGADIGTKKRQRLFLEELAGITDTSLLETFPVEFDYTGTSKKWILGSRIDTTKTDGLTNLVQRLAVKVRQYNASLYRLRRLHVYWDSQDRDPRLVNFPPPNPHGDPKTEPDPINDLPKFKQMLKNAEDDWTNVSNQVNELLETASSDGNSFGVTLLGSDMIAANGYIVSMRVVVKYPDPTPGGAPPPEVGGSSSHVSLSSAFSSSSPNP
jgi:hypothetical protein